MILAALVPTLLAQEPICEASYREVMDTTEENRPQDFGAAAQALDERLPCLTGLLYYFGAWVDPERKLDESNENNNTANDPEEIVIN